MGMMEMVLKHPEELPALLKLQLASMQATRFLPPEPHWAFCYKMLQNVSRSFAIVIHQLGPELRNAICVFYLVLRGLDTVEDDMAIPIDTKVPILKAFHEHIYDTSWHFICGEKDYKDLMTGFHHVSTAFLSLAKGYQEVISEMTQRMGNGMAKFIEVEVETIADYDEYCHYVAGIVGLGLTRLFYAAGLEDFALDVLSNSMGLFLQKTNIIRDYLEDINEIPAPRMFWPREIWGRYGTALEVFKEEDRSEDALRCLNDMITNALKHGPECLQYMSALRDPAIFRFCAIPQVMAIGTLALCYNNIHVFRGVVKIRRGLTAKIMEGTKTMSDVYAAFDDFSGILAAKIDKSDPSAVLTQRYVDEIRTACKARFLNKTKRKTFSIESKTGHEICLVLAILLLALIMILIVWR
ncbi:farnesyl-diphosphate farnesyltransferase [Marchantia polymorpha subsp. ruderalis]|uniref:Squalene synthase n=2 Tax=Marchantia polymorpha TaxID=3197 RepID=A0AAF6B5C3_MARPO|nr:hypothetical protein MARPO_0098s0008 [Marchantia polymorpha]BBN07207.1 hypothetical protein Mp_4g01910 [Marchantia polymorpha subsp. ruderalis]|eukprot:PTQ32451.1 hypothetical protein MARPO_0098s0008 [Marchantia polymorpha]